MAQIPLSVQWMCGYDFAGGLGHAGGAPPATLLGEGGKRLFGGKHKVYKGEDVADDDSNSHQKQQPRTSS